MRRAFFSAILFLATPLFAFDGLQPICGLTCEPNPASTEYGGAVVARGKFYNARGNSIFASRAAGGPATMLLADDELAGSESYSYAVPVLSLPGRNGLDVNLALQYNSRVWTMDKVNNTATFNADRDFPSYGFRIGYGYLEYKSSDDFYIVTLGDGTKHQLYFATTNTYDARDSSYIRYYAGTTRLLRFKNGVQIFYEPIPDLSTLYRPYRIQDANGNYITIEYLNKQQNTWATGHEISQITDTLNRVISFTYDSTYHTLTSISHSAPEGTRTYAFSWNVSHTINYNFHTSITVNDTAASGTTHKVLTGITYPNGTKYVFIYGDWGIVKRIERKSSDNVLRGYVEYNFPASSTQLSDHPSFTQQKVSDDGTNFQTWNYGVTKTNGVVTATTVTAPDGTATKTNLNSDGLVSSVTITVYQQSNPLRTFANTWAFESGSNNPRITASTTTLHDTNQVSKVEYSYTATYGNVSEVKEYDYGLVLKRKTQTDYQTGTNYVNQRILDRPTQMRIYDGAGALKARTDFTYDGGTFTTISGTPANHDETNYSDSFTIRGNVTKITRYTNAAGGSGAIDRNFKYDRAGNLREADLDCCNKKVWTFDSTHNWAYPVTVVSGTSPDQLTESYTYDSIGRLTTSTDPNSKTTTYAYDSTNRLTSVTRPDSVVLTTAFTDTGAAPVVTRTTPIESGKSAVEVTTMNGAGRVTKRELKDAGSTLVSKVDFQYDNMGRTWKVSNPYVSGSAVWTETLYDTLGRVTKVIPPDGTSSTNNTAYTYSGNAVTVTDPAGKQRRSYTDALGRLLRVDEPGAAHGVGSASVSGYPQQTQGDPYCVLFTADGYCIEYEYPTLYDSGSVSIIVNGLSKTAYYDQNSSDSSVAAALRAAINADPDYPVSAGGTGTTITLTSNTSGAETNFSVSGSSYSNDPSHFPTPSFSVSSSTMSGGSDTTTATLTMDRPYATYYTYDPMDNLLKVKMGLQERLYTYDSMGRLTQVKTPETNNLATDFTYTNAGQVYQRTDPRGVITTYGYDNLHRLTSVSYNVGSTGVPATPTVTYAYGTSSASNNVGRVTSITEGSSALAESYTYDSLGRVTQVTKTIDSVNYTVGYAYNWASEVTSITYPSTRVVSQSYDPVGRLQQIASSGTNYFTVPSTGYNAAGQITNVTYGNNVTGEFAYNQRLQIDSMRYVSGSTDILNLDYIYASGNNGQIQAVKYNTSPGVEDQSKSVNYEYDALGRLKKGYTTNLTAAGTWRLEWTYDRYGNRPTQSLTGGTISTTAPQLTISPTTNRITTSGYSYDANGNMTNDSINAYTWDGENRMTQVGAGAATHTYFGPLRIKKVNGSTTTRYIFSGSKVVAEYVGGTLSKEYVYAGRQLVATLPAGAGATYHYPDHLSTRVETNSSGTVTRAFGHVPFGETWYETGTSNKWKFTSYERDESNLDYAVFRYDSSRLGRFMSPDLLAGSIHAPQSLNRLPYTVNDPVNLVDPMGLACIQYYWWGPNGDGSGTGWFCGPDTGGGGGGGGGGSNDDFQAVEDGPGKNGGGGGGGGKTNPPNPMNQQQRQAGFKNCVKQAAVIRDKQLVAARWGQVVGGVAILGTIATVWTMSVAAEGEIHAADAIIRTAAGGTPMLLLYIEATAQVAAAHNEYDQAVARCQVQFGFPNTP